MKPCHAAGHFFPKLLWLAAILIFPAKTAFALGETSFVGNVSAPGSFALSDKNPATILVSTNDWAGVIRAANDLSADINRVTGKSPAIFNGIKSAGKNAVIIGTIGQSKFIDELIRGKKIDVSEISNRWESFFFQVVPQPFPGIDNALVICGSDKRGTIYGIYDLSGQIGVSPWHYWADVLPQHHDKLFVRAGKFFQGPPAVKYRGIFINDEAPELTGWVKEKFGTVPGHPNVANYGRGFYTNLFEVMLRLRANYLWPAMWNNAFNEDDPENPRLADEYGIVMGTSHQEPMLRAQMEWDCRFKKTLGSWNYAKFPDVLENFWRAGIRRNKNYESIITLGLRGADDTEMAPGGPAANKALLEKIVSRQRQMIAGEVNPDVTRVPQVWCLYKEVMDYYNAGMRAPDDVTLLWAEDNWGDVRRLPTAAERQRSGGAGVYYHFDYVGGPRNYKWINTDPIPKIWDQMSLAREYGADRVWIVNVGHFKGYELPLEYFMNLAWDSQHWTNDNLGEFTRLWAEEQFGPEYAAAIADILNKYTKYNGRRKPELLDSTTYSLVDYDEFENVVKDYAAIAAKAREISDKLPQAGRAAFYELVLFPTKACAQLNAMYLAAAKNELYARQARASANDYAEQTRSLFAAQTNLANYFNHSFAGGKWNHFMAQPYIGYTNWSGPRQNTLDAVKLTEIQVPETARMGVTAEGDTGTAGGSLAFDKFGQPSRFVDVFNKGRTAFEFAATPSAPWIILSQSRGMTAKDTRLQARVDWSKAPAGKGSAQIKFAGANTNFTVSVSTFNPSAPAPATLQGFIEADGYVSMEAEHFTKRTDAGSNRWINIPNYGHTLSGMRADGPPEALATPGKDSPCLEYKMYLFCTGKVDVETIVGPTLNFLPGRPLRYAAAFDDEAPQTVTIVPADFDAHNGNRDWEESVKNNCRRIGSTHTIAHPGYHTLKIWMVDPAVAVEKIIVNTGGVRPSYLGPPESFYHDDAAQVSAH